MAKLASFCSGSHGLGFGTPKSRVMGCTGSCSGKWLENNTLNFWAQWMEFILRGEEGEKGVNLYFVGNLYRAEGERRERQKIPRGLLRFGGLQQRCPLYRALGEKKPFQKPTKCGKRAAFLGPSRPRRGGPSPSCCPLPSSPGAPGSAPRRRTFPRAAATPRRGAPRIPRGRGNTAGKGPPRSPTAAPPHRRSPGRYSGFGGRIHQAFFSQPNHITPTLIFSLAGTLFFFSLFPLPKLGGPSRTAPPGAALALHAGCRGRAPGGARDLLSARRGAGPGGSEAGRVRGGPAASRSP